MVEETTTEKVFRATWFWIAVAISLVGFVWRIYEVTDDLSLTFSVTTTLFSIIILLSLQRGLLNLEKAIKNVEKAVKHGFTRLTAELGDQDPNSGADEVREEEITTSPYEFPPSSLLVIAQTPPRVLNRA